MESHFFNKIIIEQQSLIAYACDITTYEICYMTESAKALCGIQDCEPYHGKKCYELIQGLDAPCSFCTNSKLAVGEIYKWEQYNEKLQKWVAIDDTLIEYEGKLCRLEVARVISEKKKELSQVTNRLTIEEMLVECMQNVSGGADVSAVMNRFLEVIGKYYAAERTYIFEFDFCRQALLHTFEWRAPGIPQKIHSLQAVPLEHVQEWIEKFQQQGTCLISSSGRELAADSPEYRMLKAQGIESLAIVPLRKNDNLIGFFGVDNLTENANDLSFMRNVSNFLLGEMERRRLLQKLEHSNNTDLLTGLKNHNCYRNILNALSEETLDAIGVIYIDINGMRKLNNSYGHEYGDSIIKKTADILKRHAKDHCFRVGGDEFIVLCTNIENDAFQKLSAGLRRDFDSAHDCDVSIGSIWNDSNISAREAILRADDFMYAEKQGYYHSVLSHGRKARTGMATEVLQEISDNYFEVYYQPQVELKTRWIVGAEALVRKRNKNGGLLSPASFIPFYEREGIVSHVDMFVLNTVCAALQTWSRQGIKLNISTNFSRVTLMRPHIVKRVKECCQLYGIPPEMITIEVTESSGKLDQQQLGALIQDFSSEGFSISLDDFGSEYSNLSILTAMDFNEVKFDKTLVAKLETNLQSRIVMKYAMKICSELTNTRSLAEGIETERQLDLLLQYQCEYGQGYYFGRPMPNDVFLNVLKEERAKRNASSTLQ